MANVDVDTEGELIDTQWDVNEKYLRIDNFCQMELIDTQWDVNTKQKAVSYQVG